MKDFIAPKCNRCTGVFDTLRLGATPSGARIKEKLEQFKNLLKTIPSKDVVLIDAITEDIYARSWKDLFCPISSIGRAMPF